MIDKPHLETRTQVDTAAAENELGIRNARMFPSPSLLPQREESRSEDISIYLCPQIMGTKAL